MTYFEVWEVEQNFVWQCLVYLALFCHFGNFFVQQQSEDDLIEGLEETQDNDFMILSFKSQVSSEVAKISFKKLPKRAENAIQRVAKMAKNTF